MADPFSIISLVLTALETIHGTKDYVNSIRRAPESITNLADELSSIESLLKQLGQIIKREREHIEKNEMYALLCPPMERCEKVSKEVEKLVGPYVKRSDGVNV
jgi:chromosome segregation ATPase